MFIRDMEADTGSSSGGFAKLPVSRCSTVQEIEATIIQMLGKSVVDNGFKVDKDVARLCHAVKYLVTQIGIIVQESSEDDKEYALRVLRSTRDIMSLNSD